MRQLSIELKWAFIFSFIGLLWMVLERLAGLHDVYIDYQMYLTNLFAIPAIAMMVFALKEKKTKYYGGIMSYKQGLISGTVLSVFIALLTPLSQCITTYVITPAYFTNAIKRSVELGYFKTVEDAMDNFNYKNYAIKGAIAALIMGIITTAIVMLFLRTKTKKTN